MKKILRIFLWSVLVLVVLLVGAMALFVYKVKNGFPVSFETEKPQLDLPSGKPAVLVFSKTTGFRHSASIEASLSALRSIAEKNGWYLFSTESGGVFNAEQLRSFKAVIFDNSTGRVLNDAQQKALEQYVEDGGTLVGIHGAGDDSHHWEWYNYNLLGATFSHHPIKPSVQLAEVKLEPSVDSFFKAGLSPSWNNTDEWYVFFSQPRDAQVIYYIDGDVIVSNGNVLWIKSKNFGMGKYHPVAWHKKAGKGQTFYTSMGHTAEVWGHAEFVKLIETMLRHGIVGAK